MLRYWSKETQPSNAARRVPTCRMAKQTMKKQEPSNAPCEQYRKSPRAKWADYNEGDYFVTVCTLGKAHFLGEIHDAEMHLSGIGEYLSKELSSPEKHHSAIQVLSFVVMPNHFHALVRIVDSEAARRVNDCEERVFQGVGTRRAALSHNRTPLLSTFIGGLKSAVTRWAHANNIPFAWQPRYHDHIIRGEKDWNNIADYIENNVALWSFDCYNEKM